MPFDSPFAKWIFEEIHKIYNFAPNKNDEEKYKEILESFPSSVSTCISLSSCIRRCNLFNQLKFGYPIGNDGYSCVLFCADMVPEKRKASVESYYAIGLWENTRLGEDEKTIDPDYLIISPTFTSRDGEYRHRMIHFTAFKKALDLAQEEFKKIEDLLVPLLEEDLELKTIAYPENSIKPYDRLRLEIFCACIILDGMACASGTIQNHTNTKYIIILKRIMELLPDLSPEKIFPNLAEHNKINKLLTLSTELRSIQCGIKFTPLYIREIITQRNINMSIWREILCMDMIGDLVVNFISPSFPLFNNWTMMQMGNIAPEFFENEFMHERFIRSTAMLKTMKKIREARGTIREEEYVENYYTNELDASLYESLEYGSSHLIMSDCIMIQCMEHTGRTFASWPLFCRRQKTLSPYIIDVFEKKDFVMKIYFELLYGMHCLHSLFGIIHCDLHLNNATIYTIAYKGNDEKNCNTFSMFIMGDSQEQCYLFPSNGMETIIIDYSRALFGPKMAEHLKKRWNYTENELEIFYRDQGHKITKTIGRFFPTILRDHQAELKTAALLHYDKLFPVLCYIDYISIGSALSKLPEVGAETPKDEKYDVRDFTYCPELIEFGKKLADRCFDIVTGALLEMCIAIKNSTEIKTTPLPGTMLPKLFAEYKFNAARMPNDAVVTDIYKYGDVVYEACDYEKMPPWSNIDKVSKVLGDLKLSDVYLREPYHYFDALKQPSMFERISAQLARETLEEDGPAKYTKSSWI